MRSFLVPRHAVPGRPTTSSSGMLAPDEANHPAGANLDEAAEPTLAGLSRGVTNSREPYTPSTICTYKSVHSRADLSRRCG